ncbi:MAG: hypothetical protein R2853_04835 [Thermomicrobiales bacterium]
MIAGAAPLGLVLPDLRGAVLALFQVAGVGERVIALAIVAKAGMQVLTQC